MFRDVVTPDTSAEDWAGLREKVLKRVLGAMGVAPDCRVKPSYKVLDEYEDHGLRHVKISYQVMPDEQGLAVIVLPKGVDGSHPAPAVLCCHGATSR